MLNDAILNFLFKIYGVTNNVQKSFARMHIFLFSFKFWF